MTNHDDTTDLPSNPNADPTIGATSHGHRPGSARAAFSYAGFRLMWMASFGSNIGTWIQNVVLPAYVYHRTGKASIVGILVFAQLGPLLVLSIPAGVIADRFDRRRWLIAMQMVQLGFSIALAPLAAANAPIWALFLAALGVGVGNALNAPAWSAMLPTLVAKPDLQGAIALNSAMINGSRVAGPIIVAVVAMWSPWHVSPASWFLINAVTYLFVVAALIKVHLPPVEAPDEPGGRSKLLEGIHIVTRSPVHLRLVLSLATFSLLSLPYVGLFPAVARHNFHIDETSATYKWLYATWGFGAAIGGLAIGTLFIGLDIRRLIRLGFAAFAVSLAAFAIVRTPLGGFLVAPFLGFTYFATTTSMNTIFQSRLEDYERGRAMSLWFMAFGGTVPLGNLLFGPVMDRIGARVVLLGGAVVALVMAWWCNVAVLDARAERAAAAAELAGDPSTVGRQRLGHPLQPDHATPFDEHGFAAGD